MFCYGSCKSVLYQDLHVSSVYLACDVFLPLLGGIRGNIKIQPLAYTYEQQLLHAGRCDDDRSSGQICWVSLN